MFLGAVVAALIEITGIFLLVRIRVCFDLHESASWQIVQANDAVDFHATVYGNMFNGKP